MKAPHQCSVEIAGPSQKLDPADRSDIGRGDKGEEDKAAKVTFERKIAPRDEPSHPCSDQYRQ